MKWIMCDGTWMAHRAWHALPQEILEEEPSLVIFGLLDQFRSLCFDPRVRSFKLSLFFDSRQNRRRDIFPEYKMNRVRDRTEEEKAQLSVFWKEVESAIKHVFPRIGIPIHRLEGYEADDLIATAAETFYEGESGIIVTADSDLWQCINERVDWYNPQSKKYFSREVFLEAKGLEPDRWRWVKAIAGCSGDGVPGIKGVGEVGAIQYLRGELSSGGTKAKKIESQQALVTRNLRLVGLPFAGTPPVELSSPSYNAAAFREICKEYCWDRFLKGKSAEEWDLIFKEQVTQTLEFRQKARKRGE